MREFLRDTSNIWPNLTVAIAFGLMIGLVHVVVDYLFNDPFGMREFGKHFTQWAIGIFLVRKYVVFGQPV